MPLARPFKIAVSDDDLEDLRARLAARRPPIDADAPEGDWTEGTDAKTLEDLLQYWEHDFDWRAQERALNKLDHFMMEVNGHDMHFIHQRSPHANAIPLIIVHGWPGSVVELLELIPKLTDADPTRAFHVVAPSLPGYAWSRDAARNGGEFHARSTARLLRDLMVQLGYAQFAAQGGDWGAVVVANLATDFPAQCVALHTNMPLGIPSLGAGVTPYKLLQLANIARTLMFAPWTFSVADKHQLGRIRDYFKWGSSYYELHASKPLMLGAALHESPVALASWLLEKMHGWTDHRGEASLYSALSRDKILTNMSVYWFTQCISHSTRFYLETTPVMKGVPGDAALPARYCATPTGVSVFPQEILAQPRSWAAWAHDLRSWREHDKGGHFAAWEQPEALAQDVRDFFHDTLRFEDCKRDALRRAEADDGAASSSGALAKGVAAALGIGALSLALRGRPSKI